MSDHAETLLQNHARSLEQYLRTRLGELTTAADAPSRLVEAIEYSLLAGGKRLRPALLLETFSSLIPQTASFPSPLPAAAAIELVHTFSLVHDDLPAMDDDELRRGRPTNHKVFGEAMAILAGDAMITLAFELLVTEYAREPHIAAALARELAGAAGPGGMIGGQALDIAAEGASLSVDDLRDIHARKTGALITCACRMGAILAGADEPALEAVTRYGRHLGLAFQIADDILDVTATRQALGKATKKDAAAGKNTFPALLGIEAARGAAEKESAAALEAIEHLGAGAAGLRHLATFTIRRAK